MHFKKSGLPHAISFLFISFRPTSGAGERLPYFLSPMWWSASEWTSPKPKYFLSAGQQTGGMGEAEAVQLWNRGSCGGRGKTIGGLKRIEINGREYCAKCMDEDGGGTAGDTGTQRLPLPPSSCLENMATRDLVEAHQYFKKKLTGLPLRGKRINRRIRPKQSIEQALLLSFRSQ